MKKQIELNVSEGKTPLMIVNEFKMIANIRYHHHYISGVNKIIVEYYDL